ncbi:hypothetical protein ABMA28_006402 [Loxostege sticticalis]|uniref:Uncharacterized protein n=1 Tax=Loxostege sticticalis TaxID=481309 RepID=A0ABD0SL31_LOXSC
MIMDFRLIVLVFVALIIAVFAHPSEDSIIRERRDVMDTMKSAWNDVVKTLSDAGDAVVHVFKPTEKSTLDKIADGVKSLGQ